MRWTPLLLVALAACKDTENPEEVNENEVITTVELAFTPAGGGADRVFAWSDPENDGSPVIDPVVLLDAEDYTLAVRFVNELAEPPEDITLEVDEEGDQHQVFFTGSAVQGPASASADAVITQSYADTDVNGLPVGLASDVTTLGTGSGELVVTLRHMPPEGGPAKVAGLAELVASDGIEALPGDTDASVTFDLAVQ